LSVIHINTDEVIPLIHELPLTVESKENKNVDLAGREMTTVSILEPLSTASLITDNVDEHKQDDYDISRLVTTDNIDQKKFNHHNLSITFDHCSPKPETPESSMRISIDANVSDSSDAFFTPIKLTAEDFFNCASSKATSFSTC
jgi:hypothetical protein